MDLEEETGSLREKSIRGGFAILIGQGVKFFLNFGSQIALARLLEPRDFGLIAMVAPVLGFVNVFADLGLMQAVVQRPRVTQSQLSAVFWINAGFSTVLAAVFAATAPLLAWLYHDRRVIPVTLTLSVMLIVGGVTSLQGALLNRRLRFVQIAIFEAISLVVGVSVGVASAYAGLGYWALVLNQVAISFTSSALLWLSAHWRPSRPARDPEVWAMLRFGGHVTGANLAGYLNTSIEKVMLGATVGESGLGIYDRAWRLAVQPLQQLTAPIDRLAVPVLSRLQHDADRYRNVFVQMLQILLLLATPGLVFALVMAEPLILFLFGAKWADTVPVFTWVCIGAIISPLNISVFWLFVSQGRAREQMNFITLVSVINIAAYATGLPWGAVGVARNSAVSVYLLQTPILIWASTRTGPVDLATNLRALAPFVAAALASLAVEEWLVRLGLPHGLLLIAAGLAFSYAATAIVLLMFPSGRAALRGPLALRSMRRRPA